MRHFLAVLVICSFTSAAAFAADTRPSEASLKRLLIVTDAQKLLESALGTVDQSMDAGIKQALKGQPINEQGQAALDEMRAKMSALFKESLAWEAMEPMFIDIYGRSLTQAEVNGMLKFYESDAGKAVIAKMPLIMQNTMQAMQERMATLTPKIMQIQQEAVARMKPAEAK